MNKKFIIKELFWLLVGLVAVFLLVTDYLKEYEKVVWVLLIGLFIYRFIKNKEYLDW